MSVAVETRSELLSPADAERHRTPTPVTTVHRGSGTRRRWLIGLGLLGALAAGLYAVKAAVTPDSGSQLLTHAIARGDLVVSVVEQGTLESSNNREIKCRVKGGSTVLWVIETGTEVKPGDELVRLDTSKIEDEINEQKIAYEKSMADKSTAEGEVAASTIAIKEYEEGTFVSEQATKEKELATAESQLKSAQDMEAYVQRMFRKGFATSLELASHQDSVKQAELDVRAKRIALESLERFGKPKMLGELQSKLQTAQAKLAASTAAAELESARLERTQQQLDHCVIRADVEGLVMYPSVAEWMQEPDIKKGATVHEDQVLLIIPDLKQMQVKFGVHESKVDRVRPGLRAQMRLSDKGIQGEATAVASMHTQTGGWTGNMVKYDTVVKLEEQSGLKPGMTGAVEVFLSRYDDVLRTPVAAVVEQDGEFWCWVESQQGPVKTPVKLGDSDEQFIIVESGLAEGDHVVLNPLDLLDEAAREALQPKEVEVPPEPTGATATAAVSR